MKRTINILLLILLFISCSSSRKVDTHVKKNQEKVTDNQSFQDSTETKHKKQETSFEHKKINQFDFSIQPFYPDLSINKTDPVYQPQKQRSLTVEDSNGRKVTTELNPWDQLVFNSHSEDARELKLLQEQNDSLKVINENLMKDSQKTAKQKDKHSESKKPLWGLFPIIFIVGIFSGIYINIHFSKK